MHQTATTDVVEKGVKKTKSQGRALVATTKVTAGNRNPFTGAAKKLSKAAWDRLRVYVQVADAFPDADIRETVCKDCVQAMVKSSSTYRDAWKKLEVEYRVVMEEWVALSSLYFYNRA